MEKKGVKAEVNDNKSQETIYSRVELLENSAVFGVKPEVMAGALKLAGKDSMTKNDAQTAVRIFLERRVN